MAVLSQCSCSERKSWKCYAPGETESHYLIQKLTLSKSGKTSCKIHWVCMSRSGQIFRVSWIPVLSLWAWWLSLWEPLRPLFNVVMLLCILLMYHSNHTEYPCSSPFDLKTLKGTSSFTSLQFILRTRLGHREGTIPKVCEGILH